MTAVGNDKVSMRLTPSTPVRPTPVRAFVDRVQQAHAPAPQRASTTQKVAVAAGTVSAVAAMVLGLMGRPAMAAVCAASALLDFAVAWWAAK